MEKLLYLVLMISGSFIVVFAIYYAFLTWFGKDEDE